MKRMIKVARSFAAMITKLIAALTKQYYKSSRLRKNAFISSHPMTLWDLDKTWNQRETDSVELYSSCCEGTVVLLTVFRATKTHEVMMVSSDTRHGNNTAT